jgi:outer membrane protein assembly factor BamB
MPLLVPRGAGRQLVSTGGQAVYAYDPVTGKELWKVRHHGFSAVPRPVYGHGLVFVVTDHDNRMERHRANQLMEICRENIATSTVLMGIYVPGDKLSLR